MDNTSLGDRIKGYEKAYDIRIDPKDHIVVRLDGHKFSKLTKKFDKPFDEIFADKMDKVASELMVKYQVKFIYTQSDEITLIFPPKWEYVYTPIKVEDIDNSKIKSGDYRVGVMGSDDIKYNQVLSLWNDDVTIEMVKDDGRLYLMSHGDILVKRSIKNHVMYAGRIQKLASVIAAYATEVFEIEGGYFDGRVFGVPNDYEAFNSVYWRMLDCIKNSKLSFGQSMLSHKRMQHLNTDEVVRICKDEFGKNWSELKPRFKYGTFFTREAALHHNDEGEEYTRHITAKYNKILESNQGNVDVVCSKTT